MSKIPEGDSRHNKRQPNPQRSKELADVRRSLCNYENGSPPDIYLALSVVDYCMQVPITMTGLRLIVLLVPHLNEETGVVEPWPPAPWPSVEEMAAKLETTPRTIVKALRQLEDVGVIDVKAKRINWRTAAEANLARLRRDH
jgi:hypothetical protein